MKKIIVAATIICVACIARAGAYTWGFGSGLDITPGGGEEDYLSTGTAMLFIGSVNQTLNADGLTYSLDFSKATLVGNAAGQNGDFTFGVPAYDASSPTTSSLVTERTSQAYSLILFEKNDVADYVKYDGYYFLATGNSDPKQDKESGDFYASFTYGDVVGGNDWHTASSGSPVPEPTSGLLLLIGVAGMALRRRV